MDKWHELYLRRAFTVRSSESEPAELLQLDTSCLYQMRLEQLEIYEWMFAEALSLLPKMIVIKLSASE